MFTVSEFGRMIADELRTNAYVEALRQAVEPGSVVLDIGTGTGIFALLACQFGAGRVYAIEPNGSIQVAREVAHANGFSDRIEFFNKLSTEVTLAEQCDVIVSDLRGVLPLYGQHIPAIIDARKRFLADNGLLIPQQDTLWIAAVESPDYFSQNVVPYSDNAYGLDMQAAVPYVTNSTHRGEERTEQPLVEPQCWTTLDYRSIESPDVTADVSMTTTRAGTAHGLSVWFDATLAPDVGFSSRSELVYGRFFFPFSQPVVVAPGDTLAVSLRANLIDSGYQWRWNTRVLDQDQPHEIKADFKQSTFFGVPLSPQLQKQAVGYVPTLSDNGVIDRTILGLMNGEVSVEEIARQVLDQFPAGFANAKEALARVSKLSRKYSCD